MNFLAHIYLSGDDELVKIGNFIADGIHGKPEGFPLQVQKGILLHRAIDSFTDVHPVFRRGTRRLHERYHHYAGVIMDIIYDHFLAKNWHDYHDVSLEQYTADFYRSLRNNFNLLTERTKGMVPHMIEHNWLLSYATVQGIGEILRQMDHRTKLRSGMTTSVEELLEYYDEFEAEFAEFFEELREFVHQKTAELENHLI